MWKIDDDKAVVITTDFFTPIVDDAYDYGAIAASNALSDLYAMGATPVLALNIACLPPDLPAELVREITRGIAEKVREAGAVIAGGHTIQDQEPKVGLVAVGLAAPDSILLKGGARPGDLLLLTKPIGTGVVSTALKAGSADPGHVEIAVEWMKRLNSDPARAAHAASASAATDITGFGLLGHAVEMARSSAVQLKFAAGRIPLLPGAIDYSKQGHIAGGTLDNEAYFGEWVDFRDQIDRPLRTLLFDAQTSGGLLVALPGSALELFNSEMEDRGSRSWIVGRVASGAGVSVNRVLEGLPHSAAGPDDNQHAFA